jgi:hypothetical protein
MESHLIETVEDVVTLEVEVLLESDPFLLGALWLKEGESSELKTAGPPSGSKA